MPNHAFPWLPPLYAALSKTVQAGVPPFFLALGVTLGGGLIGSMGLWLAGRGPQDPAQAAYRIRIWAVAIAIGGTLTALEHLEKGFFARALPALVRDGIAIAMAYLGAQAGYWLLNWLVSL